MNQKIISTIIKPKKLPKGVNFGCFGNPMRASCNCCNTNDKNLENYTIYLNYTKNWKTLNYSKIPYEYKKGLFVFLPKNTNE
jgi:hypothetical protein